MALSIFPKEPLRCTVKVSTYMMCNLAGGCFRFFAAAAAYDAARHQYKSVNVINRWHARLPQPCFFSPLHALALREQDRRLAEQLFGEEILRRNFPKVLGGYSNKSI